MDQPINIISKNYGDNVVREAVLSRRPFLTHCNADTTWLLSIAYPESVENVKDKKYYHILIDPWLRGGQSDVAAFFSQQWHASPSAVQTIPEINEAIKRIEDTAKEALFSDQSIASEVGVESKLIDLVVVSHEFTDHMHKETLLEIAPSVPVLATSKAAADIQSWNHFECVKEIPRFSGDWKDSSTEPLPKWVSVSRVAKAGVDLLYYHSAIMIMFCSPLEGRVNIDWENEAVIYTPHGIDPGDLTRVAEADPPVHTLALLHGLQDISLPRAQLNKGAHNGLKVQRLLGAKYWVGTHDEVKTGAGIVSWFLNRKILTLKEALEKEIQEHGKAGDGKMLGEVQFKEIGNGKTLVLV